MEKSKKDKLVAAIVSLTIHLAIILILLFSIIEKEVQLPDGGGVLVQVGLVANASGSDKVIDSQPAPTQTTPSSPQSQEEILTQEEPSINLEEQKRKEEEELKLKEEKKRAEQTDKTVASAFSKFSGSKGDSETGKGSEGSQQGNSEEGASSGIGGYGDINLGGRGISGVLPKPAYDQSNDEGTIVINITVDAMGNVTEARATVTGSKGTAYHNPNLRSAAEKAARKTKFNPSNDPTQKRGTITYYFKTK